LFPSSIADKWSISGQQTYFLFISGHPDKWSNKFEPNNQYELTLKAIGSF